MLSPFSVTRKGTLKSNNDDDNKDFKKAIGLYVKQQLGMYSTLFFYIPLPLLQGHDLKMADMVQRNSIPGSRRLRLHLTKCIKKSF